MDISLTPQLIYVSTAQSQAVKVQEDGDFMATRNLMRRSKNLWKYKSQRAKPTNLRDAGLTTSDLWHDMGCSFPRNKSGGHNPSKYLD